MADVLKILQIKKFIIIEINIYCDLNKYYSLLPKIPIRNPYHTKHQITSVSFKKTSTRIHRNGLSNIGANKIIHNRLRLTQINTVKSCSNYKKKINIKFGGCGWQSLGELPGQISANIPSARELTEIDFKIP